jgi:surface carbohydrate biosynthesis protein
MKNIILLPVEISSRELLSKILLSYKFAQKGCEIYIGDKQSINEFIKYAPGSIYFDKGYHKGVSEVLYDKLLNYKCSIVSLDEENAVDFRDFQQINLRFPNHILPKFENTYLWGQKQYSYLQQNRQNFDENKIFITGHPRFDLLKDKYSYLYAEEVIKIKNLHKKFILVNTNFGLGNNIKGEDFIIKNYGNRFPQIRSLIRYQEMQVKNFINLCKDLSSIDEYNIILRPHPEEDITTYKDSFSNYENIQAISEGSVIPWIISSELMIHHDCTTSIECGMLGKSSIAYTKDLDLNLTTDIPLRVSYQYENFDDIKEYIKNLSEVVSRIDTNILNDYFNFQESSLDNVVNNTLRINKSSAQIKNYFFYKNYSVVKFKLKALINKIDHLYEKKIKGLDETTINSIIKKYDNIFEGHDTVKTKKIHKKLFKIYSNE